MVGTRVFTAAFICFGTFVDILVKNQNQVISLEIVTYKIATVKNVKARDKSYFKEFTYLTDSISLLNTAWELKCVKGR